MSRGKLFYIVLYSILLVRPEAIAFGADLCFSADVFLFQREILEMRWSVGLKLCKVISARPNFLMPVHNFFWGGGLLKKILVAKNMQNLAQFGTTSKFDSEYFRNG